MASLSSHAAVVELYRDVDAGAAPFQVVSDPGFFTRICLDEFEAAAQLGPGQVGRIVLRNATVDWDDVGALFRFVDIYLATDGVLQVVHDPLHSRRVLSCPLDTVMYRFSLALGHALVVTERALQDGALTFTARRRTDAPPRPWLRDLDSWSFVFITDGRKLEHIRANIALIRGWLGDGADIVVITEAANGALDVDAKVVPFQSGPGKFPISAKKNVALRHATGANLFIAHDRFRLTPQWWAASRGSHNLFDVLLFPVRSPDGSRRVADWNGEVGHIFDYHAYHHVAVAYDRINPRPVVNGGCFVVKRQVLADHPFDERLRWGEHEDNEWSYRLRLDGRVIAFNPEAAVISHSDRHPGYRALTGWKLALKNSVYVPLRNAWLARGQGRPSGVVWPGSLVASLPPAESRLVVRAVGNSPTLDGATIDFDGDLHRFRSRFSAIDLAGKDVVLADISASVAAYRPILKLVAARLERGRKLWLLHDTRGNLTTTPSRVRPLSVALMETRLAIEPMFAPDGEAADGPFRLLSWSKQQAMPAEAGAVDCWTFGIITDGRKADWVNAQLESIRAQGLEHYEVLICGTWPDSDDPHVRVFDLPPHDDKRAWITRKKNMIVAAARHENCLIMHDRMTLAPDWIDGVRRFGNLFEVLVFPVRGEDRHDLRINDWECCGGWLEDYRDFRIDPMRYDQWSAFAMVYGGGFAIKKGIYQRHPLDERLFWSEAEDVQQTLAFGCQGICTELGLPAMMYSKRLRLPGKATRGVAGMVNRAREAVLKGRRKLLLRWMVAQVKAWRDTP